MIKEPSAIMTLRQRLGDNVAVASGRRARHEADTRGSSPMTPRLLRIALACVIVVDFVMAADGAWAAVERASCSQARTACGTRKLCEDRYQACLQTGCWATRLIKRC